MPTFVHTYERDDEDVTYSRKHAPIYKISYDHSPKVVLVNHKMWKLVNTKVISSMNIEGIYSKDNDGFVSDAEWKFVERMLISKMLIG